MVSIGEEEQVSITVPQTSPIEEEEVAAEELEEEEELKIDMVPLNDTVPVPIVRTMDIGIQTTPSLDAASRRQLNTIEQQTTPKVQAVERQMSPLQTKAIIHLQRNVRFQLTPTTDARLAEKEKFDEHLLGLKPEIVFSSEPIQPAVPAKSAPQVKATKAKKKAEPVSSHTLHFVLHSSISSSSQKKKTARTPSPKAKAVEKPELVAAVAKRMKKKTLPVTPEPTVVATIRAPRKRSNAKTVEAVASPPVESVVKRAKTSKTAVPSKNVP